MGLCFLDAARNGYVPSVFPTFKSCETAVSTCAGANGFSISTLFGTPNDVAAL
jgi:hypothetical protein